MPPKELRKLCLERGVPFADCFERSELVDRAREALRRPPVTTGPSSSTSSSSSSRPPPSSPPGQFSNFGELLEINPTAPSSEPTSFVFLHGLGDSARGFAGQLPNLLEAPELRYVIPTAPSTPGFGVRSWFDFAAMMAGGRAGMSDPSRAMADVDNSAMRSSIDYCHSLIRKEISRGVVPGRIFVGGFSQGGCLAVRSALEFPDATLGGCLAVSTFLGSQERLPISAANARLPVLVCHGEADSVVPLTEGRRLQELLRKKGLPAEFRSYPGVNHAYCQEEARDVQRFLRRRLAAQAGEPGLRKMSARELKALLASLGAETAGCFDKDDLLERARVTVLAG